MDKLNKFSRLKASKSSNAPVVDYQARLAAQGLTREQVIETERKLAKFANTMDSLVRIPFTKQGMGADAALSTIPLAGDLAGLALTSYAFILGRQLGVPAHKMTPAVRLALIDMVVGIVPGIGTLLDIFIRPSRKTLGIVHEHLKDEYGITETMHMDRPFLHQSLEDKQQQSRFGFFWRNPVVAWLYLHIPDILGLMVIIIIGWGLWTVISWLVSLFGKTTGFG
ncbi:MULTISPECIES: DUF4112 domain-containing protein [unclassified Psychrobacter]|uniref:DUF4112 domain-containing protein n=1 Tax=unclassified Psychrobacter TaxID=196806 RepID=UPI0009A5B24A|nr:MULTISPECIES: DUF4112 domain-containing protein [unclassified Psychrobacter]OXL27118.1 hypothetical protein CAN34_02020 [Psychrobacter sp. DAB_AL32B]SLJ85460.1 hypothetical protein DABAL43B_2275 [Psychrobacter sp. DAB_AL43B]